ncbi:MAG TPA: polysaccharide biosynthesis/export family protein [Gemmatimonadales bacterium]|nr:polysaccharide biosynthesis/export family protein [Gemmatimonadales bacterium]
MRPGGRHRRAALQAITLTLGLALPGALPAQGVAQEAGPERDRLAAAASGVERPAPGDILRLRIWREPDLSGEFPVDPTGIVVLPKIGPFDVSSVHPDSLRPRLVQAYQVYLNNPSIEVTLLRRITVLGAVRNPGLYPVDGTMTIADALALAGGAAPDGRRDRVEIRRADRRIVADLSVETRVGDSPLRSGDQLYVPQKSWLSRNPWVFTGALGTLTAVTVALIR